MYVPSRKATQELGVHANTLRTWANEGKIKHIKTPSGQRLYDTSSLECTDERKRICYCRVSSAKQKDDLQRQIDCMQREFPEHEVIKDIGSGLNFKRKGLIALLEQVCDGNIKEVVIAHRDRLCRFGFELVRWLIEKNGGKIVVLNEDKSSPQEELTNDILSILHVFSCRMHGLRKYSQKIKEDKDIPKL